MLEYLIFQLNQLFGYFILLGLSILLPYATSYWMFSAFIKNKKYVKSLAIIVTIVSFTLLTLPYFFVVCYSSFPFLVNVIWLPLGFFVLGLLFRAIPLMIRRLFVKSKAGDNKKTSS